MRPIARRGRMPWPTWINVVPARPRPRRRARHVGVLPVLLGLHVALLLGALLIWRIL